MNETPFEPMRISGAAPADILQQMIDKDHTLVGFLLGLRDIRHHRAVEEYQAAALHDLARRYNRQGAVALEIGTAKGYSASVIADALPLATFLTLNPDENEVQEARQNLSRFDNVSVLVMKSTDFLEHPAYADMKFDFIFVDGDHKNVRLDLPFWDRLNVGGLMVFHDYSPNGAYRACPPVYRALNEFRDALGRDFDVLVVDDGKVGLAGFVKRSGDVLETAERDLLAGVNAYSSASYGAIVGLYKLAKRYADVSGAVVECGLQNGGSAAALALGIGGQRAVWGFDRFTGVPKPTPEDGDKALRRWESKQPGGWAVGSAATAEECFHKFFLKDSMIISGEFSEVFDDSRAEVGPVAVLHVDATTYESTLAALRRFYEDVVGGGLVILSAYHHWEGIGQAARVFFSEQGIRPKLLSLEKSVYWTK